MRRLGKEQLWPRWITLVEATGSLPAVEGLFARPGKAMKLRAGAAASNFLGDIAEGEQRDIAEVAEVGEAYSREMIRLGLKDWRGVGDADADDENAVLEFSPEAVELFLNEPEMFAAADDKYVMPEVYRDQEKNGSSASPNGIGEAATAAKITAGSPARPKRARAAKSATISNSSPKPTKASNSGKSSQAAVPN